MSGRNRRHHSSLEWYAYKHISGSLHLKRYLGDYGDIKEARASDFVITVTGPFEAKNREVATDIMRARFAS